MPKQKIESIPFYSTGNHKDIKRNFNIENESCHLIMCFCSQFIPKQKLWEEKYQTKNHTVDRHFQFEYLPKKYRD